MGWGLHRGVQRLFKGLWGGAALVLGGGCMGMEGGCMEGAAWTGLYGGEELHWDGGAA